MSALAAFGKATFASLKIRNYRLYFIGIGFSHIGSWMQTVALGWLVLDITGSGVQLGMVLAIRFAPLLFGAILAGNIVDSLDKRKLLFGTQIASAILASLLGILVYTGIIEMWMVFFAALLSGCTDALDRPARQTFVHEMVGPEHLRNAVALNSTEANLARAIGPLCAGILIASVGMATCFVANALSYVLFIVFLALIRKEELHREERVHEIGHTFAGLSYAFSQPLIRTILISMTVIGTLSYEFSTSLPLFTQVNFAGDAAEYAAFLSVMGIGSVVGGLFVASRTVITPREFVVWAFLFGLSMCVVAIMPTLLFAILAMSFVGFFSICLTSTASTMLQLESAPHMRGRVMSLWSMAIFGSTLIGAPVIGFIGEHVSPRWAIAIGGIASLVTALFASRALLLRYTFFKIPNFISIRREEVELEGTKI